MPGLDLEQRHDGLRADVLLAARVGIDRRLSGSFERGSRDRRGGFRRRIARSQRSSIQAGMLSSVARVRPRDRLAIHLAQHRVDESGGGALVRLLDQFDALGDGGVRRDAVQIAQLEDAHAQGDADFVIELGLRAAGEEFDQEIELGLVAQAAEDKRFGERSVASVEGPALFPQQVGRIAAAVDALEYSEGNIAGGGHCGCIERSYTLRAMNGRSGFLGRD